jgi:hypothetical protein
MKIGSFNILGHIFIVMVPLFGHMIEGFCFCYFLDIEFIWNKLSEKYWIIKIMIICMVVMAFHMLM